MNEAEQLQEILLTMDVPLFRKSDLRWLSRNLGIRNRQHPKFQEAMKLIQFLMKNGG